MGGRRVARLVVFAAVVILGLTAGVANQKALSRSQGDFLTEWGLMLGRPFAVTARAAAGGATSFVQIFRTNASLKRVNAELRDRATSQRQALARMRESQSEAERFSELLSLKDSLDFRTRASRIVTRPATPWAETCSLDVGSQDGVSPASAVIAAKGLVGQVFAVNEATCQVLLLNDRNSAVPVFVQGSRAPGVCSGQGTAELVVDYIPLESKVRKGDAVISSGEGIVFPKGILVGHVIAVEAGEHMHFKRATVRPAVSFRSLEEVLIVIGPGS